MSKIHVIETDFEPDDAIAILAHASQNKDVDLRVIVGEGEPFKKIPVVREFFKALQNKFPQSYSNVEIYQGLGSNKGYPLRETQETSEEAPEEAQTQEEILENYEKIYSLNPSEFYMMKPPREAMKLKLKCPFTTVYAYGSFNWRTLNLPVQEYRDFMSRYDFFNYYDSFTAIGENNTALFNGVDNPVNLIIQELIVRWNNHIVKKCEKDLEELLKNDDPKLIPKIQRINKIIGNVSKNIEKQYVLADVCLIFCPIPRKRSELVSMNPYPKWVPSTESNVYIFNSKVEQRRINLVKKLEELENTQTIYDLLWNLRMVNTKCDNHDDDYFSLSVYRDDIISAIESNIKTHEYMFRQMEKIMKYYEDDIEEDIQTETLD